MALGLWYDFLRVRRPTKEKSIMQRKKKTFSTIEIVLVAFMVGSLLLSFLQGRREEKAK